MQESKMPLRFFWSRVELGVLRSKILARDFFNAVEQNVGLTLGLILNLLFRTNTVQVRSSSNSDTTLIQSRNLIGRFDW